MTGGGQRVLEVFPDMPEGRPSRSTDVPDEEGQGVPRMAGVQADGWWAFGVEGEPGEVESTGAEWVGPAQGTQLSIMPGGRDLTCPTHSFLPVWVRR